jgi:hypothetical protein
MEKTTLLIRLTKAEKIQIEIAAVYKGMNTSQFIRFMMFENKLKEKDNDIFGNVDKSKLINSKFNSYISKEDYLDAINSK